MGARKKTPNLLLVDAWCRLRDSCFLVPCRPRQGAWEIPSFSKTFSSCYPFTLSYLSSSSLRSIFSPYFSLNPLHFPPLFLIPVSLISLLLPRSLSPSLSAPFISQKSAEIFNERSVNYLEERKRERREGLVEAREGKRKKEREREVERME